MYMNVVDSFYELPAVTFGLIRPHFILSSTQVKELFL